MYIAPTLPHNFSIFPLAAPGPKNPDLKLPGWCHPHRSVATLCSEHLGSVISPKTRWVGDLYNKYVQRIFCKPQSSWNKINKTLDLYISTLIPLRKLKIQNIHIDFSHRCQIIYWVPTQFGNPRHPGTSGMETHMFSQKHFRLHRGGEDYISIVFINVDLHNIYIYIYTLRILGPSNGWV